MPNYGYARVSTDGQSLDAHLAQRRTGGYCLPGAAKV
jgi:hypothetical protein